MVTVEADIRFSLERTKCVGMVLLVRIQLVHQVQNQCIILPVRSKLQINKWELELTHHTPVPPLPILPTTV